MIYYKIKGYPDYRLVRDSKRDFHVESKKKGDWEEVGMCMDSGHIHLCIRNDEGKKISTYLHSIIAKIFVPNPEGKPIVHHIDFDPSNNNPANLMWVTIEEHMSIHKTGNTYMLGKHLSEEAKKKISEGEKGRLRPEGSGRQPKPIEQWSLDGTTLIARYESISEAARQTGIRQSNISACCRERLNSTGGYKWKYIV